MLRQLSKTGLELDMFDPGVDISVPSEGAPGVCPIEVEA